MKFALFLRFFDSWYIIKYLLTETSGKQYVLWTLDCRCFPRLRLGKHRQSRVHKTYCFPRSQSISVNCCRASARQLTNLDHSGSYEISGSRANLPPELYIVEITVEISICVCYDVRFPLNRIFFSWKRGDRTSLVLFERTQFDCGIFVNNSYATNFKFVSVKNSGKNDSKYDIVSFVCV